VVLTARNVKLKYKKSALGVIWTVLNPAAMILILLAVFTNVVRIEIEAFWAFLLSGYFVYQFISQTLSASVNVFVQFAAMIRGVAIPRAAPVLAAILARLLEFAVGFLLSITVIAAFYHGGLTIGFAWVPLLLVLMAMLVIGSCCILSTLSVFFNDVEHMLPVVLMALFYVSPVIYPVSFVPEAFQWLYLLNPVASLLHLFHTAICVVEVSAIFIFGALVLGKYESEFPETV
jgi:ABC-type polysaccharide/polyol phosphate export permease